MKYLDDYIDYLKYYGAYSFLEKPFCDADNVLFNVLSYMPLEKLEEKELTLSKVYKELENTKELGLIIPNDYIIISKMIMQAKRFKNIKVSDIVCEDSDTSQFFACTYHLPEFLLIDFRGTDDTIHGWIENLENLTGINEAQKKAKEYVDMINESHRKKIVITGHSKGGNMSFYAAICAQNQDKILKAYSLDGQGFVLKYIDIDKLNSIKDKLIHIVPENSLVGSLFKEVASDIKIVKTNKISPFSHNPLSWNLEGNSFDLADNFFDKTIKLKSKIDGIIDSLNEDECQELAKEALEFNQNIKANNLIELRKVEYVLDIVNKSKIFDKKYSKLFIKLFLLVIIY